MSIEQHSGAGTKLELDPMQRMQRNEMRHQYVCALLSNSAVVSHLDLSTKDKAANMITALFAMSSALADTHMAMIMDDKPQSTRNQTGQPQAVSQYGGMRRDRGQDS